MAAAGVREKVAVGVGRATRAGGIRCSVRVSWCLVAGGASAASSVRRRRPASPLRPWHLSLSPLTGRASEPAPYLVTGAG